MQDHPRVCGKNTSEAIATKLVMGSPPRMREKRTKDYFFALIFRITPAYAGKTHFHRAVLSCIEDHPRVCGKNNGAARTRVLNWGSPPRMREKPTTPDTSSAPTRITPAYAGKTISTVTSLKQRWDHPRVCGKN